MNEEVQPLTNKELFRKVSRPFLDIVVVMLLVGLVLALVITLG